jgi:ubiquinone/menaquinone biosynthesis C-methylase UbiE
VLPAVGYAATLEYQRLDLMSKILDPWTRGYLAGLGVGQGWRCLELGGGNGSITEWLCAAVGPSGTVTAADINTVLLDLVPAQNLTVRC